MVFEKIDHKCMFIEHYQLIVNKDQNAHRYIKREMIIQNKNE